MHSQDEEYLALLKKQIEEKLGWGDSDGWNNPDFEKLNELVFEKTGVSLSTSTLKRIFGKVKYSSVPTTTTLNTLVQFIGYENWRSFCVTARSTKADRVIQADNAAPVKTKKPLQRIYAAALVILVLVSTFVWMSFFTHTPPVIDRSKIVFTSKTVSDELPNSVVFNYDIGTAHADSVIIQQSWDPTKRDTVAASGHQHTSIYYLPGYFKAKLIINKQIVSEHGVYIKTQGWKCIIQQLSKIKPFYLNDNEFEHSGGYMEITPRLLENKTGSPVFNDVWSTFYNVHEFSADPKNFVLNATVQNTSAKEASICRQMKVNIMTTNGFISIPLCDKGCTSDIAVYIANTAVDGKDKDLSGFGCDFALPHNLQLTVKGKNAVVYVDSRPVYTTIFTKPLGQIVGMMVGFEGTGKIGNVTLK